MTACFPSSFGDMHANVIFYVPRSTKLLQASVRFYAADGALLDSASASNQLGLAANGSSAFGPLPPWPTTCTARE